MNEFLGSSHYGSPGFKDPGFWDTRLTTRGVAQATALNRQLLKKVCHMCLSRARPSQRHCI